MRRIDFPPLWTVGVIALLWPLSRVGPVLAARWLDLAGVLLAAAAVGLMLWAVVEMGRARTTVWPHRHASALVTTGPFAWSRNPIYLGDVMLLGGAILWTGAVLGVLLVPLLMAILARRFISPEEARLRATFGPAFEVWAGNVRRWV